MPSLTLLTNLLFSPSSSTNLIEFLGLLVILTVMVVYIGRGNILPNFTQSMDGQGPPEKVEGIVPVSQQPPMKETDKEKEKEVNKDKPLHPFDNPVREGSNSDPKVFLDCVLILSCCSLLTPLTGMV